MVWSKPLTQIAKDYGFSDNGIRKISKKHDIPLPKSWHWSKVKHNKKVTKVKLPKASDNPEIKLVKTNPDLYSGNSVQAKIAVKKKELENIQGLNLKVPDTLYRPHIHVKNTKEYYKKSDEAEKKGDWRSIVDSSRALSINVSKKLRPRALRIFDTLIKVIEKRGYEFVMPGSKVKIYKETYSFDLREKNKRVKKESKYSWDEYDYVPTGTLCLKIYSFIPLKEWYDSPTKPLEEKLINIITRLEVKAKEDEEQRIQSEIWHKKYELERKREEELKEKRQKELDKFKKLISDASRFQKSQYLRDYIREFEKRVSKPLDDDKKEWIKWLKEKADWYDPFIEKEVELLEGIDRDTLEMKGKRFW